MDLKIENWWKTTFVFKATIHFMDSHVEYFPENLGDYSEEQGEIHQSDVTKISRQMGWKYDGLYFV